MWSDSSPTVRQLTRIAVAAMIVIAGCAGPDRPGIGNDTPSAANGPSGVADSTPSAAGRTATAAGRASTAAGSAATAAGDTPSTTGSAPNAVGEPVVQNLTQTQAAAVNETMRQFFVRLPANETERTARVARTVCGDLSAVEPPAENATRAEQLYRASQLLTRFTGGLQPATVRVAATGTRKAARLATAVGAYNEFYAASCAFDRDDPATVRRFYLASAALGFELLVVQYGAYYRVGSRAGRAVVRADRFGVMQQTLGPDTLRLLVTESHWLAVGSLDGAEAYRNRTADAVNVAFDDSLDRAVVRQHLERVHDVTVRPSLAALLDRVEPETAVGCLRDLAADVPRLDRRLPEIVADGRVRAAELQWLPSDARDRLAACLRNG